MSWPCPGDKFSHLHEHFMNLHSLLHDSQHNSSPTPREFCTTLLFYPITIDFSQHYCEALKIPTSHRWGCNTVPPENTRFVWNTKATGKIHDRDCRKLHMATSAERIACQFFVFYVLTFCRFLFKLKLFNMIIEILRAGSSLLFKKKYRQHGGAVVSRVPSLLKKSLLESPKMQLGHNKQNKQKPLHSSAAW